MLRSQIVFFLYMSLLSIVFARAVDRRQLSSSEPFNPETVTHIATEFDLPAPTSISASESSLIGSSITTTATGTATNTRSISSTATVVPTDSPSSFDDHGEYIPPPPPDEQYYQDEGADGDSTGFINVSIGAQAGIIIGIVLVGLAIMGGCVWFWNKKQAEWKAALERRRTLRASRIAAAKAQGVTTGKKDSNKKKPSGLSKMTKNGSSSTVVSTEVKPVDVAGDVDVERSQFDVMTPTESENPSWWRKVLPKKK